MATQEAAKKKGPWAKFMSWYESYNGKKYVGMVYSLGASVVIVGALFKILHLPGAEQMLFAGMMTEALLFAIGCLDKPHPEFHWEEVFPQLVDPHTVTDEEKEKLLTIPRPDLASVTGGTAPAPAAKATGSAAPRADVPALKDEDLKALKDGIADLAKTASQFSELGKVATTGVKLGEKLAAAEAATESYANATSALAQNYVQITGEMEKVNAQTQTYKQNVELVGKNIAALNSVYELQLQNMNAQVEAVKAQTEAQKNIAAATKQAADNQIAFAKEAAEAQAAFAKGAQQLQKQVTDLNAVYGNMLSALS